MRGSVHVLLHVLVHVDPPDPEQPEMRVYEYVAVVRPLMLRSNPYSFIFSRPFCAQLSH